MKRSRSLSRNSGSSKGGAGKGSSGKRSPTGGAIQTGRTPRKKSVAVKRRAPKQGLQQESHASSAREGERLQKVLAAGGVASRRECEQLILEGRVEVDGQVVQVLGTKVDRQHQEIRVDGEPLARPRLVYYAVHKPTGVVCTARDPAGRTRVIDMLPKGVGRVFNVGRLDINSEGLILVTNDGALADQLTHPRYGIEKTYEVHVQGYPDRAVFSQLHKGVHLAEGFAQVVSVRTKKRLKNSTTLEMVLNEGRNREVRRLFARVGHKVLRLIRIAIGPIRLGEMPLGTLRQLSPQELEKLRTAVSLTGTTNKGHSSKRQTHKGPTRNVPTRKKQVARTAKSKAGSKYSLTKGAFPRKKKSSQGVAKKMTAKKRSTKSENKTTKVTNKIANSKRRAMKRQAKK